MVAMTIARIASSLQHRAPGEREPPSLGTCGASPPKHAHLFMMSPTQIFITKGGSAFSVTFNVVRITDFCLISLQSKSAGYSWLVLEATFLHIFFFHFFAFKCFHCYLNNSLFCVFFPQGCCDEMLHYLPELGMLSPQFHVMTGPNMQTARMVAL